MFVGANYLLIRKDTNSMGFFYLMTEQKFKEKLISIFENHFIVKPERDSKCETRRIDIVLTHKILKEISFGIECKRPDRKRGEEIGMYVKQAFNYSQLEWECNGEFKKIPILLCPPLSYKYFILNEKETIIENNKWHKDRHQEDDNHHSFNGFLGVFNIGEVRKRNNSYYFVFSNRVLFVGSKKNYHNESYSYGVHLENYYKTLKLIEND